jgi:regulatory protein
MRITAIQPQRRDPDRVALFADGEFVLGVARQVVQEAGLGTGDEVDAAALERLTRADLRWRLRQAALDLLAYRARSAAELRRRLLGRGFPADLVDVCLAELAEQRLLDDAAFATAFARDRLRSRPRAPRAITAELRTRGVAEETARAAIGEALEEGGHTEDGLARDAARAWVRRAGLPAGRLSAEQEQKALRRLLGYLGRRGFGGGLARAAARTALAEERD